MEVDRVRAARDGMIARVVDGVGHRHDRVEKDTVLLGLVVGRLVEDAVHDGKINLDARLHWDEGVVWRAAFGAAHVATPAGASAWSPSGRIRSSATAAVSAGDAASAVTRGGAAATDGASTTAVPTEMTASHASILKRAGERPDASVARAPNCAAGTKSSDAIACSASALGAASGASPPDANASATALALAEALASAASPATRAGSAAGCSADHAISLTTTTI